jgi:hypothetical protein
MEFSEQYKQTKNTYLETTKYADKLKKNPNH